MAAELVPAGWRNINPPFSFQPDSPVGTRFRATLKTRLPDFLGCETEDVLPEYITVMIAHGKTKANTACDLEAFLGATGAVQFTAWLWAHLEANKANYASGAPLVEVPTPPITAESEMKEEAASVAAAAPASVPSDAIAARASAGGAEPPSTRRHLSSLPPPPPSAPSGSGRLRSQVEVKPSFSGRSPPRDDRRGSYEQQRRGGRDDGEGRESRGRRGQGEWAVRPGEGDHRPGPSWQPPPPPPPQPPHRHRQPALRSQIVLPGASDPFRGAVDRHGGQARASHDRSEFSAGEDIPKRPHRMGVLYSDLEENVGHGKRPRTPVQDEADWGSGGGGGTPPMEGGTPPVRQAQKRRGVLVPARAQSGFDVAQRSLLVQATRDAADDAIRRHRTVLDQVPVARALPPGQLSAAFGEARPSKGARKRAARKRATAASHAAGPFERVVVRGTFSGGAGAWEEEEEIGLQFMDGNGGGGELDEEAAAAKQQAMEEMKQRMHKLEVQLLALKAQRQASEEARGAAVLAPLAPQRPTNTGSVTVGNIPADCSSEVLRAHFSVCGDVLRATVLKDKATGLRKGTALVEFARRKCARAAATQLDGSLLLGQAITAVLLPPKRVPGF